MKRFQKFLNEKRVTDKELDTVINTMNIDWDKVKFKIADLKMGYDVELEHGTVNKETNITGDNVFMTLKIALAHLKEIPDYYDRLKKMEK